MQHKLVIASSTLALIILVGGAGTLFSILRDRGSSPPVELNKGIEGVRQDSYQKSVFGDYKQALETLDAKGVYDGSRITEEMTAEFEATVEPRDMLDKSYFYGMFVLERPVAAWEPIRTNAERLAEVVFANESLTSEQQSVQQAYQRNLLAAIAVFGSEPTGDVEPIDYLSLLETKLPYPNDTSPDIQLRALLHAFICIEQAATDGEAYDSTANSHLADAKRLADRLSTLEVRADDAYLDQSFVLLVVALLTDDSALRSACLTAGEQALSRCDADFETFKTAYSATAGELAGDSSLGKSERLELLSSLRSAHKSIQRTESNLLVASDAYYQYLSELEE